MCVATHIPFLQLSTQKRAHKFCGAALAAPACLGCMRLCGHILPEKSVCRFPVKQAAGIVIHPLCRRRYFFRCDQVKVRALREPAAQYPVHIFIAPAFLWSVRVAIIKFCARAFQPAGSFYARVVRKLTPIVYRDRLENLTELFS